MLKLQDFIMNPKVRVVSLTKLTARLAGPIRNAVQAAC